MKFKLHWNTPDLKYEDYIIIEEDTLKECQKTAKEELNKKDIPLELAWSSRIETDT